MELLLSLIHISWIAEAKAELAKPQAPDLVSLLNAYYTPRRAGAYSQKGKVSNLKELNATFNYLRANGIYNLEAVSYTHRADGPTAVIYGTNSQEKLHAACSALHFRCV